MSYLVMSDMNEIQSQMFSSKYSSITNFAAKFSSRMALGRGNI